MEPSRLFDIFLEAAHHASVIPLANEGTIYAVKAFGGESMVLPVIIAILGALAGHSFNWWLGMRIMKLPSSPKDMKIYATLAKYWNRFGFVVLIFAVSPMGNVLVVGAGMLGTSFRKTIAVVALGVIWYYGRLLF